jgi:undecaprenyl pyrophosphate phosphatase UppP
VNRGAAALPGVRAGTDQRGFRPRRDVALHLGTLLAIAVYFADDLTAIATAVPDAATADRGPGKLARLLAPGTIPLVIAR